MNELASHILKLCEFKEFYTSYKFNIFVSKLIMIIDQGKTFNSLMKHLGNMRLTSQEKTHNGLVIEDLVLEKTLNSIYFLLVSILITPEF